jgi:ribonuclease HII
VAVADPTLRLERAIVRGVPAGGGEGSGDAPVHSGLVIGCDEVGRGALAGPVAVGLCVIDVRKTRRVPAGLRDSKMLSEPRREELAPVAAAWGLASAVGYASAAEIDTLGISACLGLAGKRALSDLHLAGVDVMASTIILDGHWDWLSPALMTPLHVRTQIKADRDCASVAAASVISKVARDRLMIEHDPAHPHYGWARNKGYASEQHRVALLERGASPLHRHTWLTKIFAEQSVDALDGSSRAAESAA